MRIGKLLSRGLAGALLLWLALPVAAAHAGGGSGGVVKGDSVDSGHGAARLEVPKDPENVKGISDYEAKLAEGRSAFAKKDVARAVAAFDKAVEAAPDDARGYHLLAQAKLEQGERAAALASVDKGRAKAAPEQVEAKLIFMRAELLEHEASIAGSGKEGPELAEAIKTAWEKAALAWSAYQVFIAAHARVPDHQATAAERKKQIAAREKREAEFAIVRSKRDNK